jgi:hypothetical protein
MLAVVTDTERTVIKAEIYREFTSGHVYKSFNYRFSKGQSFDDVINYINDKKEEIYSTLKWESRNSKTHYSALVKIVGETTSRLNGQVLERKTESFYL